MSLPTLTLPTYSLTLPSNNQSITYRPFMVREEKVLLLAVQEGGKNIPDAIKEVLTLCTFNKLDIKSLPQVDLEFLFINVRNKSMGEGFDIYHKCKTCEHENRMTLDLSQIKVKWPTEKINPVIQLAEGMWVTMQYPTFDTMFELSGNEEDVDAHLSAVAACVIGLVHDDVKYDIETYTREEVVAFLESFSQEQMSKLKEFFTSAPKLMYEKEYACSKCGTSNTVVLQGADDFFG